MTKKICHETYLQSLGLFTMAVQHAKKAEEFNIALTNLLGANPWGHLSDAIYDGRLNDFDVALKLEDIEVEKS